MIDPDGAIARFRARSAPAIASARTSASVSLGSDPHVRSPQKTTRSGSHSLDLVQHGLERRRVPVHVGERSDPHRLRLVQPVVRPDTASWFSACTMRCSSCQRSACDSPASTFSSSAFAASSCSRARWSSISRTSTASSTSASARSSSTLKNPGPVANWRISVGLRWIRVEPPSASRRAARASRALRSRRLRRVRRSSPPRRRTPPRRASPARRRTSDASIAGAVQIRCAIWTRKS